MTSRLAAGGRLRLSPAYFTRNISLPKVNLQDKVSLNALLTGLGMGVAFTSYADFAGLSPQACCIGAVERAATLQVGEGNGGQRRDRRRYRGQRGTGRAAPVGSTAPT